MAVNFPKWLPAIFNKIFKTDSHFTCTYYVVLPPLIAQLAVTVVEDDRSPPHLLPPLIAQLAVTVVEDDRSPLHRPRHVEAHGTPLRPKILVPGQLKLLPMCARRPVVYLK